MASTVEICNRALQKLGASRIVALTDNSPNARACNLAYIPVLYSELRKHSWSCAIKRAELAALSTAPLFGKTNAFQLPADFLRLLAPDPEENLNSHDWQIEQNKIYTNYSSPLQIRYIFKLEDAEIMDDLFREALSAKLAMEMCEEITQSNTKKQLLRQDYIDAIREAKRVNAIERPALDTPEDTWLTVRA